MGRERGGSLPSTRPSSSSYPPVVPEHGSQPHTFPPILPSKSRLPGNHNAPPRTLVMLTSVSGTMAPLGPASPAAAVTATGERRGLAEAGRRAGNSLRAGSAAEAAVGRDGRRTSPTRDDTDRPDERTESIVGRWEGNGMRAT